MQVRKGLFFALNTEQKNLIYDRVVIIISYSINAQMHNISYVEFFNGQENRNICVDRRYRLWLNIPVFMCPEKESNEIVYVVKFR